MTMTAPHLDGAPVPPPPITQKMFIELHPTVIEKDNSIHSEHGVVHYPFWFGGLASCVSSCCTQPLGVAGLRLQTLHHDAPQLGMIRIWHEVWISERFLGL